MTKNQFRALCAKYGVVCRYSGEDQVFYLSGTFGRMNQVRDEANAAGVQFGIVI